jgi:hypothetical protein
VPDDQPDLPEDLIQLQATVFAAQDALKAYDGDDRRRCEALRQAERDAVLALHRHPDYQPGQWQALRKAAGAPEDRPKPE